MKYRTSIGSAAAVFCAASCICAAADGPAKAVVSAAEIGTAVQASAATVVFGAGLATPVSTFAPQLFERTWTSHGASGGTEADEGGWRAFTMQTSKLQGAPVVRGRARFSENGDGTVRGEWIAVPDADAPLAELCVSGNFDLVPFAGGTALVDGKAVAIPADCKDMHVFRGPVSTLVLRDRAGEDRLRVAFDGTTRVLLQDNRAWGGNNFSLRFFFAEGPVSGGTEYAVRATFATPADGLLVLNDGRPVTLAAGADWIPVANEPWIESGSALDFSEVVPHHAPAGKYGRVVAVGDHFEFENRPGVPQRFYGVNICGDANTPSTPEAAEKFAANLARIGYNSLRIHHHERAILGGKGPAQGAGPDFDDTKPDPAALDRFDSLVAACAKHGVYITTDLFVSRSHFTTWRALGIDRDGCLPGTENFKMLCAFWEPAFTNLCEWTRNFLGHVNPYTGLSLAEDPALCTLALVNEGNLGNWGPGPLRDLPGVKEAWEKWLDEKIASSDKDGFDWASIPRTIPDELYADDGATPGRRHAAAFAQFLADSETRLAKRLTAFLRDELRCKAPLTSLSCWYNPVQYQLPRETFDFVDDHFYVDHPAFLDKSWKLPSRCANANPMKGSTAGARSVAFRRLSGKPFTITEWNYAGPGRYRGVGGIATGVLGALQNWSGMWRFAWSHGKSGVEKPETRTMGYFDMSGDPLGLAAERAALCLFLRGDIAPLKAAYPVVFAESDLRNPSNGAPKCQATGWLWAAWNARLSVDVASGGAAAAKKTKKGGEDAPGAFAALTRPSEAVKADLDALGASRPGDGAVSIDRDTGTFLIDTPRTVGGFAEEGAHVAGCLSFALSGAPATVWASSLDGAPVAESGHVLVTHLTDVQNSDIKYADEALTILLDWGHLPHVMRRGAAKVSLRLAPSVPPQGAAEPAPAFRIYRLSPSGKRLGTVPAEFDHATGLLSFDARTDYDPESATFLYEIVRGEAEAGGLETASPLVADSRGAADSSPPSGEPVSATPVWGSALSFSPPADLLFRLGAYTPAWKFRGGAGGSRIDGDPDGTRAFSIDMAGKGGENVAAGALRFDGRATFRATGDGAVEGRWSVVPDRDGDVAEVMLETRFPVGRVAGGFLADGRAVPVPQSVAKQPHLFRGAVSRLAVLGADGNPWMEIEFPETQRVLVQDNRSWGSAVVTLRIFFAENSVKAGVAYPVHAVFRFPGHAATLDETGQVVMEAGPDWIPVVPPPAGEDWIEPGSALDFSSTVPHHEPAGKFGRVVAVGDHFEFEGRPGEEVRFCGVNLVHGANTPSVADADRLAANLARFGFNSVRLHHHERPLLAKGDGACLALDPDALDRFDALVAACVRHGLYLTTDLYVSRGPISWRSIGIDRDGNMLKEDYKTAVIFHEGAYSNLVAWSRQFMLHVNPYTGRSLAEEPALATLALVNEGNLGNYGRDALLSIPGVREAWEEWCAARGKEPRDLSDLSPDLYATRGEGRALTDDFALFLADMEARFFRRVAAFVRGELGCAAPLSNDSSWYNPDSYALLRSEFDYDDDHGYVDHPYFLGKQWALPASHPGVNPLLGNDAVPGFAWRRLFGKPFCVTEWNWAAPGQFRAASGLVMGALAARQDWSGMWRFAWSHDRPNAENPGSVRMRYFDLAADPTQRASERATVSLFLRGDMSPLPPDAASPVALDAEALRAGKGAAKRMGIPEDAPSGWEKRIGVSLSDLPRGGGLQSAVQGGGGLQSAVRGEGGLQSAVQGGGGLQSAAAPDGTALDPVRGTFAVVTPRTAGGFAPEGALSAGPVAFALEGAPAAVWATSLDGAPISASSRILVSHVTDSKNTGARFDDAGCRVWLDFGTTPVLARRGSASVSVAVVPGAWTVWRLSSTGRRLETVPCERDAGGGFVNFLARTDYDPAAATFCYELSRD